MIYILPDVELDHNCLVWAAVQVHGSPAHSDVDGLSCSFLPISSDTLIDCGTIPINCMVGLMGINSNAILWVSSFHRLLVLPKYDLQYPINLSNLGFVAVIARNLCPVVFIRLKVALTPRGCTLFPPSHWHLWHMGGTGVSAVPH